MGNQQERLLAWLAGIIDGEGSISVQVYNLPDGRVRLTPFASIVNGDIGILEGCEEAFREIGVAFRRLHKPISNGAVVGIIQCWNIRVDGIKPVKTLIEHIVPYLRSIKRTRAETILEYLRSREERGISRNEKGHIRRAEYSQREIELIASVRSHPRAKSSEAICRAPNVLG